MPKNKSSNSLSKIILIIVALFIFVGGSFLGFTLGAQEDIPEELAAGNPSSEEASVPSADDHIIVKFKDEVSETDEKKIEAETRTTETKTISPVEAKILDVPDDKNSHEMVTEFRNNYADKIEYAELDSKVEPLMVPNDPNFAQQWALSKIKAPAGWDITQGSNTMTIAVLDTGVKTDHPDLKNKIVSGYNVVDNNTDLTDLNGHGTMMMGIAGAQTNNTTGMAGVGINQKIMMIRISNNAYGWAYWSDMAEAIIYAADHGVKVISISFGGTSVSTTVRNAVNYAHEAGVFITAAAGNSGTNQMHYPAAHENVISVGATDSNDLKASWSNWGSWVDVTAPGVAINTTNNSGTYSNCSGTSPATPHVAGLASLILSLKPNLTPEQVESYITQYSDDLGSSGRDDTYGYGRINLSKALSATSGTPAPVIPTGEISGKVFNSKDNSPVVGAKINVMQSGVSKALSTSLSDGTYTVKNLNEGLYEMTASASGYDSLFRKDVYVQAAKTTIDINFSLNPIVQNGNIYGKVINYKGRSQYRAIVMLQMVATPRRDIKGVKKMVRTNSQGNFYFADLPEGTYYLRTYYYGTYAYKEVHVYPGSTTYTTMKLSQKRNWRAIRYWVKHFYRS